FAICLYNTLDGRQLVHLPKLLLFDEVDAPLHPSMSKIYIDSIQHSLVEKSGLSVIATTHSPTTVALAPEESIYLMQPDGLGLRKVSKSEALNVLTEGVPTLAVSFDGRRQVFVESPIDAELYDLVFQLVKSTIGSQRSLVFIPTGAKDKKTGTDQNTGSSVVSSLVKSLINSGNQTVFGVLDWDKHHTSSERICILSENRRYSIENVIYDPAVVIAFLCKEAKSRKDLASLPRLEKLSYSELLLLDSKEFQELVDEFSNLLVPNTLADTSKEVCNYLGGMQLQISTQLLLMNGHQLEDALIEKFPSLKGHKTHGIMKTIVESVFTDAKQLIPCDFLDLFRNLTNIATH
ncbi:MAG: ATP-binding protein, partial [Alphaproteobacteria bacterium]|nr:ATP-binding protein [Alphaproteobacteria bacterium]